MKPFRLKKCTLLMLLITGSFLFSGCDLLSNYFLGIKANIKFTVLVFGNSESKLAHSIQPKSLTHNYDQISITPTKYLINLKSITIWEEYTNVDNNFTGKGKHIQIDINEQYDLCKYGDSNALFEIEKNIKPDQIAKYNYMELKTDDKCTASGSVTIDDTTYTFTEQEINLSSNTFPIVLSDDASIDIKEGSSLYPGIAIDIGNIFLIRYTKVYSPDAIIIDKEKYIILDYNRPIILAFTDLESSEIKRLSLDITNDNDFDSKHNSDYKLNILCILDKQNNLLSIGWIPVYGDALTNKTGNGNDFEPAFLPIKSIDKNNDGSYNIDDISYSDVGSQKRALHFPSFKPESHTGIFYYGDEGVSGRIQAQYSAIEIKSFYKHKNTLKGIPIK